MSSWLGAELIKHRDNNFVFMLSVVTSDFSSYHCLYSASMELHVYRSFEDHRFKHCIAVSLPEIIMASQSSRLVR
jgi:hypothetical protein